MKISVPKKYWEAYQDLSWSDVKYGFYYCLRNPDIIALALVVFIFVFWSAVFGKSESIVRDEL